MKKVLLFAVAAVLMGSTFAHAEEVDDIYMMNQEGKIEATQMSDIRAMIADIEGMKTEADTLYQQDGVARVGDITKIENEAQIISDGLSMDASANDIDAAYSQVSQLKQMACSVIGKTICK